jgi:hypothetical protein
MIRIAQAHTESGPADCATETPERSAYAAAEQPRIIISAHV